MKQMIPFPMYCCGISKNRISRPVLVHVILVDEDLTATQVSDLCDELKDVDGITQVVSLDSIAF